MSSALALLRRRPQFGALLGALALSYIGSGAAVTALTLYVQQTEGTGTAVAALLIAEMFPKLLGPLAGSIADRVDLRRLMIRADVGQAAIFATLAFLPPFAVLLGLAALTATLQTVHSPARNAAVPALVEDDELLQANGLTGIAFNLYVAVGPLVGGLLFAFGGAFLALLANAVTFLASALLTRAVPPLPPQPREDETESFLGSARSGLRYALGNPLTRVVTLSVFFSVGFLSIDNVALVFLVRETFDSSAAAYGLVSAAFGAGMLIASVAIVRGTRISPAVLYLLGIGLCSVGLLLTGLAPVILLVVAVQVLAGAGNGIENIASDTLFQRHVPRHLLGRVYGVNSGAAALGAAIAMVLGGVLVDNTSPRFALIVAGAGGLLVTAIAIPALLRARPR